MKDIKYIFKRILIGTGIALLLASIRNTFAMELYSAPIGQNSYTITEGTTSTIKSISGNPYANMGTGYLHFSFSVNKFTGSSTSNIVVPRLIMASSGGSDYICDTGTVSTENSTFTGISFSATCPIKMGSQGLTSVSIFFSDFPSSQSTSGFYLVINSPTSFEKTLMQLILLVKFKHKETQQEILLIMQQVKLVLLLILNNKHKEMQQEILLIMQ